MNLSIHELLQKIEGIEVTSNNNDDLFDTSYKYTQTDIDFLISYFNGNIQINHSIFELSPNAFDIIIHAWLSELPVQNEIVRFGHKLIAAAEKNPVSKYNSVQKAETDRTDINTLTVLNASGKVYHEVHRLMGLLRFSPDDKGEFIAKCEPDHFILPALDVYFTARFGETAWSIIDEKRGLTLRRLPGERAEISVKNQYKSSSPVDEWEDLWKHYHKTINNEDRFNPDLQRQLMPKRYWKYLPEVK